MTGIGKQFWPECKVPACTKRRCIALDSDMCFDHTPGNRHVKLWRIDARTGGNSTRPS